MNEGWFAADWDAPPNVRTAITTRGLPGFSLGALAQGNLGTRVGDDPRVVARNRALLREALDLPAEPVWLRQLHGTTVYDVDAGSQPLQAEPEADATITRRAGVVLAILTADCLPVLLAADDGSAIGAAHAGWRGLAAGVLEATVTQLAVAPSHLHAWLGPAAGPAAYEVGEEVRCAFVDTHPAAGVAFIATRPGHWLCDLYALARMRLRAVGVTRIGGGTHCTIAEAKTFYSHRRDGHSGRMASLLWLVR